jgi:hypothetical protein
MWQVKKASWRLQCPRSFGKTSDPNHQKSGLRAICRTKSSLEINFNLSILSSFLDAHNLLPFPFKKPTDCATDEQSPHGVKFFVFGLETKRFKDFKIY